MANIQSENSLFKDYTVKQLRSLCRTKKIKYYYKFHKDDMINALLNISNFNSTSSIADTSGKEMTYNEIKAYVSSLGYILLNDPAFLSMPSLSPRVERTTPFSKADLEKMSVTELRDHIESLGCPINNSNECTSLCVSSCIQQLSSLSEPELEALSLEQLGKFVTSLGIVVGRPIEYSSLKLTHLKTLAKARRLCGYSTLCKPELVSYLTTGILPIDNDTTVENFDFTHCTVTKLKRLAKSLGIRGISKLRKSELVALLDTNNLNNIFPFDDSVFSSDKVFFGAGGMPFKFHKDIFTLSQNRLKLKYINVRELRSGKNEYFNVEQFWFVIRLKKVLPEGSNRDIVTNILRELVKYVKMKSNFLKGDKIDITVQNPRFKYDISAGFSNDYDVVEKLTDKIVQILTSDETVVLNECIFRVTVAHIPRGGKGIKVFNLKEDRNLKRCIRQIKNTDNLCGGRAVVVGLTYLSNTLFGVAYSERQIQRIREGTKKLQTNLTLELCKLIDHDGIDEFTYEDFKKCEEALDIQIVVIDSKDMYKVSYKGVHNDRQVYLLKDAGHFDCITSAGAFFARSYFCTVCFKGYEQNDNHVCRKPGSDICGLCGGEAHSEDSKNLIYCTECNRYVYNSECMIKHRQAVCPRVLKCHGCDWLVDRAKFDANKHKCGVGFCKNCQRVRDLRPGGHECYISSIQGMGGRCPYPCKKCFLYKVKPCITDNTDLRREVKEQYRNLILQWHPDKNTEDPDAKYVFGKINTSYKNIEGILTDSLTSRQFHENADNFLELGFQCTCRDDEEDEPTVASKNCAYTTKYFFFDYETDQSTGVHQPNCIVVHNFEGERFNFDTNDQFCEWLLRREHKNYTCIAHYAKGFDAYFILQYVIAKGYQFNVIMNGTKINILKINPLGIKIIDSYNHVTAPLASFPKTFGLTELRKGYFPHLFNTAANANYVGPIPDKKFYCYDRMKLEERVKFMEWHQARMNENYVFNLREERLAYCDSDVDILRRGMLQYREDFLAISNIDPLQYITISAVCLAVYRSKFLVPDTLAILDPVRKDQYSKVSIGWLNSFENPNIKHALNGGEVGICGGRVDGYDAITKTIYQFQGCFFHGCTKCYGPGTLHLIRHTTMGELYQATIDRTALLKNNGYKVVEIWECEWKKSPLYKKYKNPDIIEPLNVKDAFFGGRTECFKLKREVTGDEKIRYIDVVSLYPTVQYYDAYPLGHPKKIYNPLFYNLNWFGFMKCKVLAPRNLYLPVLPVRVKMGQNEKLVFPLCVKCAELNQSVCNHTDEERMFVGTWTTVEVREAFSQGYQVVKTYEVWHFEKTYTLWNEYVKSFMKIKLETSPHTFATKEEYMADIKRKLDIDLDKDSIAPNPGKRAIAKICLNSLWGRFGMRQNQTQTKFVKDISIFYTHLLSDRLENMQVLFVDDKTAQMTFKYKEEFVDKSYDTNLYVAAFTTANARLRLYEQMRRVDHNILYCDTDSIVYVDDGSVHVNIGDSLGEWTDELGQNDYITKWLCTAPKSYSYKTFNNKECVKIKGFTLHHRNADILNSRVMEEIIDGVRDKITIKDSQISRDKKTKNVINRETVKSFSLNFNKRSVVSDNFDTLPWGYGDCN